MGVSASWFQFGHLSSLCKTTRTLTSATASVPVSQGLKNVPEHVHRDSFVLPWVVLLSVHILLWVCPNEQVLTLSCPPGAEDRSKEGSSFMARGACGRSSWAPICVETAGGGALRNDGSWPLPFSKPDTQSSASSRTQSPFFPL